MRNLSLIMQDRSKVFQRLPSHWKQRITCVKCNVPIIELHQIDCGCRICYSCLEDIDNEYQCPGCSETVPSIKHHSNRDKAIEKEILVVEILCINKGCTAICKIKDLQLHLESCDYREEMCSLCQESYPHVNVKQHRNEKCQMITVNCNDCGLEMKKKDLIEKHKNINNTIDDLCSNWKDICPYKCCEEVQESIKCHLYICPYRPICCALKTIGCDKILPKQDMEMHHSIERKFHTELLVNVLRNLKEEEKYSMLKLSSNNERNNAELKRLKEITSKTSVDIDLLKNRLRICHNMHTNLQKEIHFIKRVNEAKVEDIQEERYGECTWKIENIIEKIKDSKNGLNTQLISTPFYSSNPGYKICLKIYPNGDSSGMGNYVSVYFALMKGKYDNEIQWPFNKIVTVKLLNKRREGRNKVIRMKPDVNDMCYGRPKQNYNVAAGQPKFLSHLELVNDDEYLDNGCIFFRISV